MLGVKYCSAPLSGARWISNFPTASPLAAATTRSTSLKRRIISLRHGGIATSWNRGLATPTSSSAYPSTEPDATAAVVVGAGPAGLAVVGNLLAHLPKHQQRQIWVDPLFASGRIGIRYREVPSNTKAALFLKFATSLAPFRHILDNTANPNAATKLANLSQDKGCELGYAADLCLMLTDGVQQHYGEQVASHKGRVVSAVLDESSSIWTATLDTGKLLRTERLILCTGSSPTSSTIAALLSSSSSSSSAFSSIVQVPLDTALKPSILAQELGASEPITIAVVGASHSAILVLMNLYKLASTTHPNLRIKWFTRHSELKYAKEMEGGWILYDNTGLKGEAAQWARENLEDDKFASSKASKFVTRVLTRASKGKEADVYAAELPGCTHIIQAIGYARNPPPELAVVERPGTPSKPLTFEYDNLTGKFFHGSSDKGHIPGLFGAGIAFPERVVDPAGNEELAVGMWKFMRFLKDAVPKWVERS